MTEITRNTLNMPWEQTTEFPGRAAVKILRDDTKLGMKVMIVRLPPGGDIAPHSHRGVVQHYILEGEYEHQGGRYGAGTYRMLPAHVQMARITTECGATILMIYDPAQPERKTARDTEESLGKSAPSLNFTRNHPTVG